jgi:hypothetical protein
MNEEKDYIDTEVDEDGRAKEARHKPEEENWLDRICNWGHEHPVAIALIVIFCPFFLIWLGARMATPLPDEEETEEEIGDITNMHPVPIETIETTRYKWVENEDEPEV